MGFFEQSERHVAAFGGADGGGGFAATSSPQEVKHAVEMVVFSAGLFNQAEHFFPLLHVEDIQDPELKTALTRMFISDARAGVSDVAGLLTSSSPPNVHFEDRCIGPEGDVDASTNYQLNSPICFSRERLTRVPPSLLEIEATALFFHELAHQFGFGESIAVKVQKFLRPRLAAMRDLLRVKSELERARSAATAKKSKSICLHVGSIIAIESRFDYLTSIDWNNSGPLEPGALSQNEIGILKQYPSGRRLLSGPMSGGIAYEIVSAACEGEQKADFAFLSAVLKVAALQMSYITVN